MVLVDEEGRVALANPRFLAMFGYASEEAIGEPIEHFVPADLRDRHSRHRFELAHGVERAMSGRELVASRKDGSPFSVEIGLSPVAANGRRYTLATVADITARRAAEQDLAEREQRLRALMENANDAIAVVGADDGLIRDVNQKMMALLGVTREQMVGREARDFAISSGVDELVRLFYEAAETGSGRLRESYIRKPDGTVGVLDFSLSLVDVGGERLVLAIGREITQERALEEQLRQAQRMEAVGRLAGGIAHDFNNLLTAILGYARLLATDLPADDERQPEVAEIIGAGVRATELTRQLLAFSRQQVLEPRVVDLNQLISGVHRILDRIIGEDVSIELRLSPDTPPIFADPGQMEQVLMNLVVNARDALDSGGVITIATDCRDLPEDPPEFATPLAAGRYTLLSVSDNGSGIPPEVMPKIFDPFFTTKGAGKGTGLGLATVLGIVEQTGGGIRVDTVPGGGTTFTIALPGEHAQVDSVRHSLPVHRDSARRESGETILLVEDDEAVRRLTCEILNRRGYDVVTAASLDDAMRAAANGRAIDLLLTDVIMPGGSGRALAETLRARRPGLRVLYMSGYTDEVIAFDDVNEPGVSFLQKPFTPESLAGRVRELLDEG